MTAQTVDADMGIIQEETSKIGEEEEDSPTGLVRYDLLLIEDLKQQKREEIKSTEGLDDGRRRWFNHEIERLEEEVRDLLEDKKGGSQGGVNQ